jgi:multiple sugar transport system substrate-binding protein
MGLRGKLDDLTDILTPMKAASCRPRSNSVYLYNDKTKKRAYYAFPIKQQTMHIEIWLDMLEVAGFKESDIPTDWKGYWAFWCDKVQPAYRQKSGTRNYATGFRWAWTRAIRSIRS